jgi:ribose transport system ATP-binding protein
MNPPVVTTSNVDAPAATTVLEAIGITKRFPGVLALSDVSFDVRAGEVHVLFGENGAGKSTLVNTIAGTLQPDEGSFRVRGVATTLHPPLVARRAGVNAVFQDFSLVPTLTVAENLLLGREPGPMGLYDRGAMRRDAAALMRDLDATIDLDARASSLSRAQQQLVEIAKGLAGEPSLLILDEPTASLTERETDQLFEIVTRLKTQGIGIVYITHRMAEIWRIGDRITVLRDGAYVATLDVAEAEERQLIELMAGRPVTTLYPRAAHNPGEVKVRAEGLSGGSMRDVTLEVRAGEVVGIAGLVGSGKSDIGRLLFGLERAREGRLLLDGEEIKRRKMAPGPMLRRGVVYYPSDRRRTGLIPMRSVRENIVLSALGGPALSRRGMLRRRAERKAAEHAIARLRIQPPDPERPVSQLSGGNQQKVVLARALLRDAQLHIFDEPTAGVDVGARVEVYEFIRQLCEGGRAVLLISSDLPEVVNLSHRVYVVHNGLVRAHLEGDAVTEENVLANFFDTADADRDGA